MLLPRPECPHEVESFPHLLALCGSDWGLQEHRLPRGNLRRVVLLGHAVDDQVDAEAPKARVADDAKWGALVEKRVKPVNHDDGTGLALDEGAKPGQRIGDLLDPDAIAGGARSSVSLQRPPDLIQERPQDVDDGGEMRGQADERPEGGDRHVVGRQDFDEAV
eukprot:4419600-Pyramimonas_sp.AAC.1